MKTIMATAKTETTTKVIMNVLEKGRADLEIQKQDKLAKALEQLENLGLSDNSEANKLIRENIDFSNRLISLFKELNNLKISVTPDIANILANNLTFSTSIASILRFFRKDGIDVLAIPFPCLVTLSKSEDTIIYELTRLYEKGIPGKIVLDLIIAFPESVASLSQFIINLQSRAYSLEKVVVQLKQFNIKYIDTVLLLLNLLLDNELFDDKFLTVFLRQQQHLEIIYEGAKKLESNKLLTANYFVLIEQHPENAVVFSKLISLLCAAPFFNYQNKEHLAKICGLSSGSYHFLQHLIVRNMLDETVFELVCRNHPVLSDEKILEAFRQIPLFEYLTESELTFILDFIDKNKTPEYEDILEILARHHFKDTSSSCNPI